MYKVKLTHVATINPEYATYLLAFVCLSLTPLLGFCNASLKGNSRTTTPC